MSARQVANLVVYGSLPSAGALRSWEETVMRHSALPVAVEAAVAALPHDAHPMGSVLAGLCALSTCHPEQNPALAGQGVYKSREVQDKQIVRLIGACVCVGWGAGAGWWRVVVVVLPGGCKGVCVVGRRRGAL
jgi:citrate synthase